MKDRKIKDKRPVNLDLLSLSFPPMAINSILHRLSGLIMILLLPVILIDLGISLKSAESFENLKMYFAHPIHKLVLWGFASTWCFHVLAGIRHMLMDVGIGEDLTTARRSAVFVIVFGVILSIISGIKIW